MRIHFSRLITSSRTDETGLNERVCGQAGIQHTQCLVVDNEHNVAGTGAFHIIGDAS